MNFTFKSLKALGLPLSRQFHKQKVLLLAWQNVLTRENSFGKCINCEALRNRRFLSTAPIKFSESSESDNSREPQRIRVYSGILSTQMRVVKLFSLMTSAVGLAAQPILYKEVMGMGSTPVIIAACSFFGFFTVVTPLLLHFITKKYITCLDYKPSTDSYVASTFTLFCTSKELEFKPDDVRVPDVPGMFTTFVAKGVPLFLDARLFEDPSHYGKIMGYDKPIDLKLYETSDSSSITEKSK